MDESWSEVFKNVFFPILSPIFSPINSFLSQFYQPYATICAIGFFVGTMIWVGVFINERYVNRGRSERTFWTDLRLWTVISMLPHILMYLYFR